MARAEQYGHDAVANIAPLPTLSSHFVFNTLSAIQYHILQRDNAMAISSLTHFAKLLRSALYTPGTPTLADDLEALQHYLALERMRFENFDFRVDVADGVDLLGSVLPAHILQPKLENMMAKISASTRHGILLMIKVWQTATHTHLSVDVETNGRDNSIPIEGFYVMVAKSRRIQSLRPDRVFDLPVNTTPD